MGIVGGAVLVLSIKHYWDQRDPPVAVRGQRVPTRKDLLSRQERAGFARPDSTLLQPTLGLPRAPLPVSRSTYFSRSQLYIFTEVIQ